MLKIWGRRSSANVQKAMWMIGELNLAHEHTQAGGPYGLVNTPEFRAMNPNGLVPVINDDGMIMWESNAIVRYLAAQYGGEIFWPADPRVRAHIDQWMDWSATSYQPHIVGLFWAYWRAPENQRNPQQIKSLQEATARDLIMIGQTLANQPFITGDKFTIADIPIATHLYRYYTMGLPTPKLPNIESYYARVQERAAYREHVMISYEELRGKLTF
jgi:glutathione S-transferase